MRAPQSVELRDTSSKVEMCMVVSRLWEGIQDRAGSVCPCSIASIQIAFSSLAGILFAISADTGVQTGEAVSHSHVGHLKALKSSKT